jgi:prophage antirepressor-like protein
MAQKLIDMYNHILKFNQREVYIAFHTKTNEAYFNAKQVCEMLEYSDYHDALKKHVNKNDILYLKDIIKNYKTLYKNVQGHSKFINEGGLYSIILKSNKKNAKEIYNWITHEVMPSLRKYGEYKTTNKIKHELDKLNELIETKNEEIKILKYNLKKPKLKEGKLVYILRIIKNSMDFNTNEIIKVKFGKSRKFKIRKAVYDCGNENRVQILKTIKVKNPENIERCVKVKMEEFTVMKNKEFYECSYNQIINVIANCIKFYEGNTINKNPENDKLSRQQINNFNTNKKLKVKFLSDDEFDKLFENIINIGQNDTDTDELLSSDNSDLESSDDELDNNDNQKGGDLSNYKYLLIKQKYLTLKYDLL